MDAANVWSYFRWQTKASLPLAFGILQSGVTPPYDTQFYFLAPAFSEFFFSSTIFVILARLALI
jgi:hypothetical protein